MQRTEEEEEEKEEKEEEGNRRRRKKKRRSSGNSLASSHGGWWYSLCSAENERSSERAAQVSAQQAQGLEPCVLAHRGLQSLLHKAPPLIPASCSFEK